MDCLHSWRILRLHPETAVAASQRVSWGTQSRPVRCPVPPPLLLASAAAQTQRPPVQQPFVIRHQLLSNRLSSEAAVCQ